MNENWKFQWKTKDGKTPASKWHDAKVPGDVHLDLLSNGFIPEPLNDFNSKTLGEIENRVWFYRRNFRFDIQKKDFSARLIFEGLDCIADIYLNGTHLGRTENSFIQHAFDVAARLRNGDNEILVRITNGLELFEGRDLAKYTGRKESPSYNDERWRIWLRKPQFSFGWDWAPRLITCGIWRDVQLQITEKGFADNFHIRTKLENKYENALLDYNFFFHPCASSDSAKGILRIKNAGKTVIEKKIDIKKGFNNGGIRLKSPLLWWPSGYGEQALYNAELILYDTEEMLADTVFGIREIKISEKPVKEGGKTFCFIINGKKIYCQGSNWVPADSITARVTEEKINCLLQEAVRCNFNMFRVWGGGIYEQDYFYRRCDELGIIIWQDFMYACALYPDDDEKFYSNCHTEAETVIRHLRNHPCIVLWCGNNEIHDGYYDVYKLEGVKKFYGAMIWEKMLPELLEKDLPGALYRPASPYGGTYHRSDLEGDAHCLMAGLTLGDSTDIRIGVNSTGRLNSEYYSWNSPPSLESMKRYLPPEELRTDSKGYIHHANTMYISREKEVAKRYISARPEAFPLDIYIGAMQRLHGQHMKMITDSFRRHIWLNSGALFWMYNDSWPTSGWTTHDYYARRKALFYYMKQSFSPVTVSIQQDYSSLSVWASNISDKTVDAVVEYGRRNFTDGEYQYRQENKISLKPASSVKLGFFYTSLAWPWEALSSFAYAKLSDDKKNILSGDTYFFSSYKGLSGEDFSFGPEYWEYRSVQKPSVKIKKISSKAFEITTDKPAFSIHTDTDDYLPDDNFFDLMPGEKKIISLEKEYSGGEIKISTLNDIIIYLREKQSKEKKIKLFG